MQWQERQVFWCLMSSVRKQKTGSGVELLLDIYFAPAPAMRPPRLFCYNVSPSGGTPSCSAVAITCFTVSALNMQVLLASQESKNARACTLACVQISQASICTL